MSDKFFFKGRQDARQSHISYGYQTKASHKPGTQKHPLELVVTSEARQQEVAAMVKEANLYANIQVNVQPGATESISELTVLLDKSSPLQVEKKPERNEACLCGSGIKYKKCCA
ncbi:zinc chelation protein SecC [Oceanisphaera marina]|uniref:Zinc chelation protein SecC n=1 Tax=Oceanisphaera marina TaxID=2017550 RepID=A0ABQ1INF2_9GAMM|nr:PBPRA1643 family SWIM/SEC-C metal-binding motif protein [Oceanisphaera marina]GGB46514.1 zinc chelation protein SecC [Oceanisphaera marina]